LTLFGKWKVELVAAAPRDEIIYALVKNLLAGSDDFTSGISPFLDRSHGSSYDHFLSEGNSILCVEKVFVFIRLHYVVSTLI
jgi:hypothetical protein